MVKDMDLELKLEVVGYIGGNGRRVLRDGMASDNRIHQQPNMKGLGPMDCRTVMDLRLTLMMVSRYSANYLICFLFVV